MLKDAFKKLVVQILQFEAKLVLKKYKPKIIAVTGSVGKTSVKEAIFTVLEKKYHIRKSDKSYNSELGVPLTIINRPSAWNNMLGWIENIFEGLALIIFPNHYPDWLVLEVGADRPGDIKKITTWLKPDIVVVTHLPDVPVHVEFFPSAEAVAEEKWALVEAVKPNGIVILNNDDARLRERLTKVNTKLLTYGLNNSATVWASDLKLMAGETGLPTGLTYKLNHEGRSVPVRLSGVVGESSVYVALAASVVGIARGLNELEISEAFNSFSTPPGRMRLINGIKETLIIDDTYNASPAAMKAGLSTLSSLKITGRKFAVLGDMLELGEFTISAHREIGELVKNKIDKLVLVGMRSKFIAEGALEAGFRESDICTFDSAILAGEFLQQEIMAGDVIYFKGSQRMRLEKAVEEIMLNPENKVKLLCRQEKEWQSK